MFEPLANGLEAAPRAVLLRSLISVLGSSHPHDVAEAVLRGAVDTRRGTTATKKRTITHVCPSVGARYRLMSLKLTTSMGFLFSVTGA